MQNNKLSIITICYNDKNLEKTCKSIINQSWQEFEWIVIDGGSSEEIQKLWNKYKFRINTFVSEKDNGIYDAYNKGIRLASGKYLLFLNSGDSLSDKDVLRDIFKDKEYNADILYGDTKFIKNKLLSFGKIIKPADKIDDVYFINENICTPSTFIRRELFNKLGYFNLQYKIAADLEKWIVFQQNGANFQKIHRLVSNFDLSGISSTKKHKITHREELQKIYNTHYSKEFYEQALKNYKRQLKPMQRLFSILNSKDGHKKEIRIFNILFVVENTKCLKSTGE